MDDITRDRVLVKCMDLLNQIRKNTEKLVLISEGNKMQKPKIDAEVAMLLQQSKVFNAYRNQGDIIQDMVENKEDK